MFGNRGHSKQTKAFITAFATLFNDIRINPYTPSTVPSKEMTVPIAYGPKEKWLTALRQDPDKEAPAIVLPRMGFEITGFTYNPEKNFQASVKRHMVGSKSHFSPASYRIDINLNVIAKYQEDMFDIIEQIIPYFRPNLAVKVKIMGSNSSSRTMEVNLMSLSPEVEYDGTMDERRVLIYTISFAIDVPYFIANTGTGEDVVIKKAIAKFNDIDGNPLEILSVYPGLTADGEPTTDPEQSIPYTDINHDDNFGIIIEIEDV